MSSKEESSVHTISVGPVVIDILRGAANDGHTCALNADGTPYSKGETL